MTSTIGTAWLDEQLAEYWTAATVHAYLIEDGTTFDPSVDLFLSDIPALDRIAGPTVLTGKAHANGYFTANDVQLTLGAGDVAEWFLVVRIGASEATSPIIGATDVMADDVPLNLTIGSGGILEFDIQALGLGRI